MRCEDSHFFVINLQFLVTKLVLLSIVSPTRSPRVHWRPFPHTAATLQRHSCAPAPSSAPNALLLMPPVCTGGPFRSRVADDYARLESAAIPLFVFITRSPRVRNVAALPPSASQNRLSCALGTVSAHGCHVSLALVCTNTHFRTQVPLSAASRVQNTTSTHTTPLHNSLLGAPEAVFVHDRPVLTLVVCAQALLRTQHPRSTLSRVHQSPFPHPSITS